jgi:thimet oligopeptidase
MMTVALLLGPAALANIPAPDPIDWRLTPRQIASSCKAELQKARAGVQAALAQHGSMPAAVDSVRAIETALADLNTALAAQKHLAFVAPDKAVREASAKCTDDITSFTISVSSDPVFYRQALAAQEHAPSAPDKQLAKHYVEAGRRSGAHLNGPARAEMTQLLNKLAQLKTAYMQTMGNHRPTIEVSKEEAASFAPSFLATLKPGKKGYLVPVSLSTQERFLRNTASGEARKRYLTAFFNHGGKENSRRVKQAIALRHRVARLAGFDNYAAYQLDTMMAKTPERAFTLLNEISAKLMPKARAELAALAALKAQQGDNTPFAAWDYVYYQEQLEQTQHAVDSEAIRQHFPVDKVIPAVLDLYEDLIGVRFHELKPANAWAPDVLQYAITDAASGKPVGQFYLDLVPRPDKALRPASFFIRLGRTLPDGSRQLPLSSIIGNGPASEPGKPALFSHRDVIDFFHEVGHLMHDTLSTAPYSSLFGSNVRADFWETPSQMLENWMWQPSILKKVSSHVETGKPLPDELIATMLNRRHGAVGVYWTRQAFLGVYDLTLHTSGPDVDATKLWFDLMPRLTPLPPPPAGTIPDASFLPIMGNYEARYYGYAWSLVFAQDMFTVFQKGGLENPEVGMRYRREILEPGGMVEPEQLLENFLGRPVRYDAFYKDLGITQ